jgi:restriction endonuclease S subunit
MSQEFLDQQLLARSNEIYATARGTAQKNMDMTMFRSMELAVPDSLAEQKRIVELLDVTNKPALTLTTYSLAHCVTRLKAILTGP